MPTDNIQTDSIPIKEYSIETQAPFDFQAIKTRDVPTCCRDMFTTHGDMIRVCLYSETCRETFICTPAEVNSCCILQSRMDFSNQVFGRNYGVELKVTDPAKGGHVIRWSANAIECQEDLRNLPGPTYGAYRGALICKTFFIHFRFIFISVFVYA